MRYLFGAAAIVAMASAFASDAPIVGAVHNTKDNGWLSYDCSQPDNGHLTCDITQVMVRKKLKQADVESRYQAAIKNLDAQRNDPSMKELCQLATGILDLLHGGSGAGLPAGAREPLSSLNTLQRRDAEQQWGALAETCATNNLDGMRRFIHLGLEKEARTCLVSTNRFEQTFRRVEDSNGKLLSWAVGDTSPQGDCGLVQMSRFRPADPNGKTDFLFWQYLAKRATSNPEGKFLLGSCKDFDESETLYDWKPKEIALKCDYIEYSPL